MVTIKLGAMTITHEKNDLGGASIESDLQEKCPECGYYDICSCEDSDDRRAFNHAMDGLESFVLALVCAGVKVDTPQFEEALQSAIQGCANNI